MLRLDLCKPGVGSERGVSMSPSYSCIPRDLIFSIDMMSHLGPRAAIPGVQSATRRNMVPAIQQNLIHPPPRSTAFGDMERGWSDNRSSPRR